MPQPTMGIIACMCRRQVVGGDTQAQFACCMIHTSLRPSRHHRRRLASSNLPPLLRHNTLIRLRDVHYFFLGLGELLAAMAFIRARASALALASAASLEASGSKTLTLWVVAMGLWPGPG
eukprot:scaffold680318_cov42-Prasinocladus_malaysianus.AAC.1